MSYPDPRYLGEGGEISAAYRPVDQAPELISPSGNSTHYLATGKSTHGLFGLYRLEMGPAPGGAKVAAMSDEEKAEFYLRHDNFWL